MRVRRRILVFRGFDQALGQAGLERGVDRGSVRCDLALEVHERRDSRAARPDRPPIGGRLPFFAFDGEDISQPFFEQVGAP